MLDGLDTYDKKGRSEHNPFIVKCLIVKIQMDAPRVEDFDDKSNCFRLVLN